MEIVAWLIEKGYDVVCAAVVYRCPERKKRELCCIFRHTTNSILTVGVWIGTAFGAWWADQTQVCFMADVGQEGEIFYSFLLGDSLLDISLLLDDVR